MIRQHKRDKNRRIVEEHLKDKPSVSLSMPNTLIIETGAVCQLSCLFCPQSQADFDLSRELMKFKDFRKIIDYFEDFLDAILLFNWGEPLLNPSLVDMIKYAAERKIYTTVHSNLNFLTQELAEGLIKSGLSEFVASIDGASEESYQAYRKGGSFDLAFKNLKLLLNQKNRLESKAPTIIWKFLVFKQNEHEINQAKLMADELGVSIDFKFAVAPGDFEPSLEEYNNKDFVNKFIENYDLPCDQLWKAPVIYPGGTILPCCMVKQKKYIVGNLFHQDFRKIWNNGQYQSLRKIAKGEITADASSYCYNCVFNPKQKR